MTQQFTEAPLTTTMKIGGGKDDPWVVIRSRDAAHLQSQLMELGDGSVATTLGEVTSVFGAHYRTGKALDAKPMDPQPTNGSNAPLPQAPPAPPAPPAAPPAPPAAPAAPPVAPPAQPMQQMPPMQQNQGEGWPPGAHQQPGEWPPAQAQAPQPPMQQMQQPPMPPAPPAPAAAPSAFAAPPTPPNAPIVLGRPARFQQGSGSRGPWSAFFDPRSPEELAGIPIDPKTNRRQSTDDENHPGLAAGTHEFTRFLH